MIYSNDTSKINDANDCITFCKSLYYNVVQFSNLIADNLNTAITIGGEQEDLKQIVDLVDEYFGDIYVQVDNIVELLKGYSTLKTENLVKNKTAITNFINTKVQVSKITTLQVDYIRQLPSFIYEIDKAVCNIPLDISLDVLRNDMTKIPISDGVIKDVPKDKFTIQRILWDIYEDTLIMQYGNKVYDSLEEAIIGSNLLDFPAPFGRTIYIPMSILVIKSGITSISEATDCILIDRRWIYVDKESQDNADYVARSKADKCLMELNKILTGAKAVPKADSLKCTIDGQVSYQDGDYYLNYNNLRNRVTVYNGLDRTGVVSNEALSSYQGAVLNKNKLNLTGGTLTGNLATRTIYPSTTQTYSLGTSSNKYNEVYIKGFRVSNSNTYISGDLYNDKSGSNYIRKYVFSGYSTTSSTVDSVNAVSKATFNASQSTFGNNSVIFCWE